MSDSITSVSMSIYGKNGNQPRMLVVNFNTNNPTTSQNFNVALQDLQTALTTWANKYQITLDFTGPKNA